MKLAAVEEIDFAVNFMITALRGVER